MAIKKAGDKWAVDIRPNGAGGARVQRRFKTKAEAQRFENYVRGEVKNDKEWNPDTDNRKLSDLIDLWHTAHGQHLKDGERRKRALLNICAKMGEPTAKLVKPSQYTDYRSRRILSKTSPKTCNNELSYLNAVYNELRRTEAISYDNPLRHVRPLRIAENELSYLEPSQINELLSTIERFSQNKHVLLVTKLSLSTGARWSEAEGLTRQRLKRHNVTFTDTKSGKNRTIPISKELFEELDSHLKEHDNFGTSSISAFRRAMDETSIKLPKGQMAHVLRHTFASHFMMNGGNILTLQRALGHSNITMTMRYAHLSPEHLEEVTALNPLAKKSDG